MFSISTNQLSVIKRVVTADEVGKYVDKVQSRLNSPAEKKSKAFAFARLYYDARDYETAKKYVEDYLSIQDREFRVHNLMGQCEEALGNHEGALASYKRSLELCSTQNDILVKVISLCVKCPMDPLRAKLWADKGSRICPGHPAVFDLKWHLLENQRPKDFEEMESLLADELARRAREPSLHIKLVKLYMEAGSYKRAFLHCQSVQKTGAFDDKMSWLECACDVFDFHRQSKEDGRISASLIFASTLCKLMALHLKQSSSRSCTPLLHRFDKTVKELISHGPLNIFDGLTPEWKDCITEMKGQLYLSTAIYIIKLAQESIISWMKAKRMSVAVLMACWQIDVPQTTLKLLSRQINYHNMQGYDWSTLACSRLSQSGHLLLYLESLFDEEWMRNCIVDFCTDQGHAALLDNIYPERIDSAESFLAGDVEFKQTEFKIPDTSDLLKYDEVSVAENASNLHHIVWIGLQWSILQEKMKPGVGVIIGRLFEGISFDVKNMNNCHHSSLCLRDIEAFVYAVLRSGKNIHLDSNKSSDSLKLSPTLICPSLVTEQQQNWWQAAYGLYTGKFGTQAVSKLKTIMQKGLETIRCMQNHGIDPRILIYISLAFSEKGLSIETSKKEEYDYKDHWQSLQKRAMHYMKEALHILEIFRSNKTIPVVEHPLILPLSDPIQEEEITLLLNKNYLKLAESAMLGGDLQEALKYYEEVKSLQSFYSQSQIYIRLASSSDRKSVEGEKHHLHYIKKAKEKLSVCINNSDHSPEFKQTLIHQLHELETTAGNTSHSVIPKSKKALNFQVEIPDADVGIDDSHIYANNGEIPNELEKSVLQEQLDAKESEIKSLKQALSMYKAHIDMQKHYQVVQPVMNQQPLILQPFPPNAQHRHIRSLDSTASNTVTPLVQNEMGTPTVPGGLETPSDMWWDSFSPQPSFEKGYFAGLAKHAQQSREEKGEGEAPTLKDSLEPSIEQPTEDSSMSLPSQSTVDGVLAVSEAFTPKEDPNIASSPAPVQKESHSPKTPTSPSAYEGSDIYVEPIVHLTSKSEIVTGEEGETVKFVHRAKLYRFDKDASQWKERGLGDVKILYDEKTNKSRITMRREQVFRVCCNHFITSEMNLETKQGSKAAWSWFTAADATDEETRPEQFTIKFKTQETADQFKEVFIECQKMSGKEITIAPETIPQPETPATVESVPAAPVVSSAPLVNPFLNLTTLPNISTNLAAINTPPQQSFAAPNFTPPTYPAQPSGFQFTFGAQNQPNMLGAMPFNGFNGFTFQPQIPMQDVQGEATIPPQPLHVPPSVTSPGTISLASPTIPVIVSYVPQPVISPNADFANISNLSGEVPPPVSGLTPPTFSGFSFSNNKSPENNMPPTVTTSVVEPTASGEVLNTDFPMMSSLLKDSTPPSVPPVTPEKPVVIEGMGTLPVFEKGLLDININPASFWTQMSPEKPFFTGNTVGLEAIGHKEEQQVVDEDELLKESVKDNNPVLDQPPDPYTYDGVYNDYKNYEYYDQNGEYYREDYYDSANDDDDDDVDGFYDNGADNQPSRASSSRRGSDDEDLDALISEERPVEDRFDIQKKIPNMNIIDVIDDDLVITMERIPSFAQKLKASRFQLPSTFYLYEAKPPCNGCRGCIENFDATLVKPEEPVVTTTAPAPSLFSTLASQAQSNFSGAVGLFSGAGAQLFGAVKNEDAGGDGGEGHTEGDFDPHYDAIVQLQKVENVQTGEEDDEVMFKHRAKLYRFDEKWRERGVGDMKLTKNIKTGYCRVLMRREQIHKLCANHAVMPNMVLKPLNTSDSSLVWFTPSDYSEGLPPVPQKLCVKFKNKQIADQFKEKFELCKQFMDEKLKAEANQENEDSNSTCAQTENGFHVGGDEKEVQAANSQASGFLVSAVPSEKGPNEDRVEVKQDLRSKFAPKAGSWECSACMLRNESSAGKCVACETPNPNKPLSTENKAPQDLRSKFAPKAGSWECSGCLVRNDASAGKCVACETPNPNKPLSTEDKAPQDLRSKFAPKAGSWECSGCLVRNDANAGKCVACETPNPSPTVSNAKPATGFSFGVSSQSSTSGFSFGVPADTATKQPSGFSFGTSTSIPSQSSSFAFVSTANTSSSFSFGTKTGVTPSTFSFVAKPEVLPSSPFTFGNKSEPNVTSFSFGTKPETASAGFSFGTKPNIVESPSLNVAWGNDGSKLDSSKTPQNREKVDSTKFEADPNTWECVACLAKNNGSREYCHNCNVRKEKTPVVTLDPSQFSTPINQQINTFHVETPMQLKFDPVQPISNPPFSWDPSSLKSDVISNKERDKELMPPPKGLPVIATKVSPKQEDKRGMKTETLKTESSWMPQGLNLSNLFSFGTTPSPSLSNASSIDDLSQASTLNNVPAAFSGTSFTFKFEPPSLEPKTPTKPTVEVEATPASPSSPNEYYDEEEDGHQSFEFSPLVSVTQIKHRSGEEDEDCIFTARSKMFRFDGQWKERGVGEIKILRHNVTKQYRLIMRRDQTHKLCANHGLLSGMDIKPMQGAKKAYVWKTFADISDDGETKEQLFAARFKEEAISDEFRDMFDFACSGKEVELTTVDEKVAPEVIEIEDSDDDGDVQPDLGEVSVDYEASVDEKAKQKAKELLLPVSFYHVPSIGLLSTPDQRVDDERPSTDVVVTSSQPDTHKEETPQLTLTHEKIPEASMEHKSEQMLLPKGFYNYKESANLTDENVEVITDDDTINLDEIYSTETDYSPFELDNSFKIIFDELCSIFRISTTANDYVKLKDGNLKIKEDQPSTTRTILLVCDEKIYFSTEITKDTVLVTRTDSKNTYDIETINLAQKKVSAQEKFALKFQDLLTCEKFASVVDESKDYLNAAKSAVTTNLPAFGARLFGNSSGPVSFASLIGSQSADSGFQDITGQRFEGAGKSLFVSEKESTGDEAKDPSIDECNVYVEPLVQLESVETSSGEEKEWMCFNQRCKLYIFDTTTKKWKERGVGDIKLLRHKEKIQSRVVMRRDQVHKLCANHMLLSTTKLEPFKSKDNTVTWNAIGDVSNGTPEDCILAARFKNDTILGEFKQKFGALCNGEAVEPLIRDGPSEGSSVLRGTCDPNLTKCLNDVKP